MLGEDSEHQAWREAICYVREEVTGGLFVFMVMGFSCLFILFKNPAPSSSLIKSDAH